MDDARNRRWLRFLVGGGINTAFTYGVYLLLNQFLGYQAAYLLAYAAGIVFSYWFNAAVVFRIPLSWKGLAAYPLVYIIQYGVSASLLGGLVGFFKVNENFAPLIITAIMVPVTYLMSKLILSSTDTTKRQT